MEAGTRNAEPASVVESLIALLARLAGRLVVRGFRHLYATGIVVLLVLVAASAGLWWMLAMACLLLCGLVLWRLYHRSSYRRLVVSPWRASRVYRRRWHPAMVTCGLTATVDGQEHLPALGRVTCGAYSDRVEVRLLCGQAPEDFEQVTAKLAHTFGASRCRMLIPRPGRVCLELTHADPLRAPVAALEPAASPDLAALPVGRCQDGAPWFVRLLGSHLLIAGATGSGKGSVVWSLIRAMGSSIRDGVVQVWALDPKGGMELTPGSGMFTRFAYESPEAMVDLLEDAVAFLKSRAERLRAAGLRMHEPSVEDPLLVLVVDELAALTAYLGDRNLTKRAEAALQALLSQGRAPGVLLVAAVQDPGKDVVAFRDLFPTRIGLRLLEDVQVDMILGRAARQHGAECDQIPPSLPGIGYVVLDGIREPVRVRASQVTDADLAQMVEAYAPVGEATTPDLHLVPNNDHVEAAQ